MKGNTFFAAICFLCGIVFALAFAALLDDNLLPPCQTEDSVNCYWDADTMGNSTGNDIVSIEK